jgi:hypothetical protein
MMGARSLAFGDREIHEPHGAQAPSAAPQVPLENFAVRTDAHQPQCRIVRFFVDKKQVGLQGSLAMIRIFARQRMIVESLRQGMIRRQK